MKREVSLQW